MTNEEHLKLKEEIYNTITLYAGDYAGEDGATAMKAIGWDLYRTVDWMKRESDELTKQGKE